MTPHPYPSIEQGLASMGPGVRVGKSSGPWRPGLLTTLSGEDLAEYYDMDGWQVADILRLAYKKMYDKEAPAGDALYWLRWLDTTRSKKEWKSLMADHADYHWGSGVRPSIWYGIWKGLERNVRDLIRGLQDYPNINEPIDVTLMATGEDFTYSQWIELSNGYISWAARNIGKGLLSINHLDAIIQGLNSEEAAGRKFAVFNNPYSDDDEALSWGMYMGSIGYDSFVQKWRSYSMQGFQRTKDALNRKLAVLGGVSTALSYASGKVVLDKFQKGVEDYFITRKEMVAFFNRTDSALAGGDMVMNKQELAEYNEAKSEWLKNDQKTYNMLNPIGMWGGATAPGQLRGLGAFQQVAIGVALGLLAGLLSLVAWQLSLKERAFQAQRTAYERSQEALDVVEVQARKGREMALAEIDRKVAAGEMTESEAAAKRLGLERELKSELSRLADRRAAIPAPQQPEGLFSGAGNLMGGVGLTAVAAVAGLWLWKRQN